MRVFKIAAGVILILSGVFCFANPGATFPSIAFLLGCTMLLSGMSGILAYVWITKKRETSNLLLVEGLLSVILGSLVVSNQLLAEAAIPVFFGMWVMFSGIMNVVEAYTHRKAGTSIWVWLLTLGLLGILIGLYAFFNTVIFTFPTVMLVGIMFVMQGVYVLLIGINLSFHHHQHQRRHKKA